MQSECGCQVKMNPTHAGQSGYKGVHVGVLGGSDYLLYWDEPGIVSVGDVLGYSPVEEHRLLRDDAEVPAEGRDSHVRCDVEVVQVLCKRK